MFCSFLSPHMWKNPRFLHSCKINTSQWAQCLHKHGITLVSFTLHVFLKQKDLWFFLTKRKNTASLSHLTFSSRQWNGSYEIRTEKFTFGENSTATLALWPQTHRDQVRVRTFVPVSEIHAEVCYAPHAFCEIQTAKHGFSLAVAENRAFPFPQRYIWTATASSKIQKFQLIPFYLVSSSSQRLHQQMMRNSRWLCCTSLKSITSLIGINVISLC